MAPNVTDVNVVHIPNTYSVLFSYYERYPMNNSRVYKKQMFNLPASYQQGSLNWKRNGDYCEFDWEEMATTPIEKMVSPEKFPQRLKETSHSVVQNTYCLENRDRQNNVIATYLH